LSVKSCLSHKHQAKDLNDWQGIQVFMAGGLDILIVGIAGENLDHIASDNVLRQLFDEKSNDDASLEQYLSDFSALVKDPTVSSPRIFYLAGEHLLGSQLGAGLGYVIFDGNNNALPRKLDDRIYGRIGELKQMLIKEAGAKGIIIPPDQIGVFALNVYDS
jgi:hypothetical protein